MAKNSLRWNSLLQLATLLSRGKAVLEELVDDDVEIVESPKKRKRSPPRNHHHNQIFKKPSSPNKNTTKHRLYMDGHILNNNNMGAVCVIEKALFPTDVNGSQCRLSVPLRQVSARFLFPGEVERLLAHGGITTTLIQPSLKECEITFGFWASNTTYVLKNGWKSVCQENNLREGMVVRLWAFRRSSHLCLALEKMS